MMVSTAGGVALCCRKCGSQTPDRWLNESRNTQERRKCTNDGCRRIHTVLPDCLVPYKHYASEVIAGVLDEVITPDDADTEDYPCEATMHRWKHWLMVNYLRMEGYLKSIGHRLLGLKEGLLVSTVSLLEKLRLSNERWLEAILRMIYNSGGFLESS